MPGLMESLLAGGMQGLSNATQQNNAVEIARLNRDADLSIKELMDQRIAERAATAEQSRYERNREDIVKDQGTAQKNALALQKLRNEGYAASRASGSAKGMAGYTEWKKDNPDGTYEDYLRTVTSAKDNEAKRITDTAIKMKSENIGMTDEEALSKARYFVTGDKPAEEKKTPQKPLSAF